MRPKKEYFYSYKYNYKILVQLWPGRGWKIWVYKNELAMPECPLFENYYDNEERAKEVVEKYIDRISSI